MIDIHSHLLPGVDDGSRTIAQSVEVLGRFKEEGVREVVLTPHLRASQVGDAPIAKYQQLFHELAAVAPDGITLHLGFEIMLDQPGADLRAEGLSLGGSPAVLVEFSRHGLPPNHVEEIFRIRMSGRIPVVAHPERYPGITTHIVGQWRASGAVIQVDAAAPLTMTDQGRIARELIHEGLADLLAADNHGNDRSLGPAAAWLAERYGTESAQILTSTNAGLVLQGAEPLPYSTREQRRGLLNKLRGLLRP